VPRLDIEGVDDADRRFTHRVDSSYGETYDVAVHGADDRMAAWVVQDTRETSGTKKSLRQQPGLAPGVESPTTLGLEGLQGITAQLCTGLCVLGLRRPRPYNVRLGCVLGRCAQLLSASAPDSNWSTRFKIVLRCLFAFS
jgi:hypothetical protein